MFACIGLGDFWVVFGLVLACWLSAIMFNSVEYVAGCCICIVGLFYCVYCCMFLVEVA